MFASIRDSESDGEFVFKFWAKIDRAKGYEKLATNISLYFENGTRYVHYNGRRIGTPMRSIEWCHFQ